ncbi:MAG TPA: hypothetical protein VI997_03010 [Candidatus Thermoplasmatota archaeon]|nr:hypothetical protein [Candidatus Thermoplasmatota archaeon]
MRISPKKTSLAAALVLLALPLAGCVENMQDLKDKVTGETVESSSLADATGQLPKADVKTVANTTANAKAPVARVSIYAEGGALVFKSSFAATETSVPTILQGGASITFTGSDSEAVDTRATLKEYVWTVTPTKAAMSAASSSGSDEGGHAHADDPGLPPLGSRDAGHDHGDAAATAAGAMTMTGVSVQHAFPAEGGVFVVSLVVKDSLGASDAQSLVVGVNPAKVTKSVTYKDTVSAGHGYTLPDGLPAEPDRKMHSFNISGSIDDLPAKAEKAVLTLTGTSPGAVDLDLSALNPAGEDAGASQTGSSSAESLEITGLVAGDWTAVVSANVGAAADYELVIDVTYQPENPDVTALFGGAGGDGHGDHAH